MVVRSQAAGGQVTLPLIIRGIRWEKRNVICGEWIKSGKPSLSDTKISDLLCIEGQ